MKKKNISIYVHWPFCSSKCPYCDFNSHIKRVVDNNEWGIALTTELHYLFASKLQLQQSTQSYITRENGHDFLMAKKDCKLILEKIQQGG